MSRMTFGVQLVRAIFEKLAGDPVTTVVGRFYYNTVTDTVRVRTAAGWQNLGGGGAASPSGAINAYAGATAPSGWLLCDGEEVSRASYADLFNVIGETYGAGDGSTTFNLPDLRGEFVRGLDNGRGIDAGRTLGSDQGSQYGQHSHPAGPLSSGPAGVPHTHTQPSTSSAQGTINNRTFLNHITGPGQTTTLHFDAGSTPGTTSSGSGPHSHPTPSNVGTAPAPSTAHSHPVTGTTGNAGGTPNSSETRPRNVALNYIIKV